MSRAGTGLRVTRAAVFAALCVTMSATTHILVSRAPLPLPVVAAVAVGIFAAAYLLAGRERRFGPIAAALVPQELAADTLFNSGQHTCYGPDGGPVTGSWRSLHESIVCQGGGTGGSLTERTTGVASGLSVNPWLLLSCHVVVGLIAACLLRHGERWLHRGLRTVFRPLLVTLAALFAAVPEPPVRRPAPRPPVRPAPPILLHSLVRRGPPVPAVV